MECPVKCYRNPRPYAVRAALEDDPLVNPLGLRILHAEGEAAAGVPVDQAVRHFGAQFGNKGAAGEMHRDDHIGRKRFHLADRVVEYSGGATPR